MPKVRYAQTSFVQGEITPLAAGRSDVDQLYRHGAESLRNFALLAQGGARVRPGQKYLATLPQNPARLEPFVFNLDQKYAFAFSDQQVDIYLPNGTLATTLSSAPWTPANLDELEIAHFGDTMFVFHADIAPQKIVRTGSVTFTLSDFEFEADSSGVVKQPYYKYAPAGMTMTPSGTTGSITLTLSSPGIWTPDYVGLKVRYKGKQCTITAYTSPTQVTATADETLSGTSADADWDEATFSTVRGWPRCGTFFNNRLILGGAKSLPSGFWASKVGAFFNFDLGTGLDDEAIWESIALSGLSTVRHLLGHQRLLVFADTGIVYVAVSDTSPLTPENVNFKLQQPFGANFARPQLLDQAAIYVQDTGSVVREAFWDDVQQQYSTPALSLRADHVIDAPKQIAVLYGRASRPEQYGLFVNADGTLGVFHTARSEEIAGWSKWETDGLYKSVAAVADQVFVAVERTIDGATKLFLEVYDDDAAPLDAAMKVTSGTPTKTFAGFTHLAGETVHVVTKGHYLGTFTVSAGGVITLGDLDPEVTEIEAGFWTQPLIRPLPVDFSLQDGDTRGLMKRLIRALVQVDRSGSFTVQGRSVLMDFAGDDFATAAAAFTGQKEIRLLGVDREAQIDLLVANPAKVTVLSLTREVQLNG